MDRHELWKSIDLYKRKLFIRNEIKKQLANTKGDRIASTIEMYYLCA